MFRSRHAMGIFASGLLLMAAATVWGQDYPNKSTRIVTPEAGGSADFFLRLFAHNLAGSLGHSVIIDNRTGSGIIPGEIVSKAPPDGYTLLFTTSSFWINPLMQKTPYDPIKDFTPIAIATRACSILVVTPSLPVNSVKDLIALAKAKPGELNYASGSSGSASHLAGSLFKALTGINIVHVTYKGSPQALVDVMSGQAQMMFPNAAVVPPHLKSGRLRALAVTSAQPSALFPGLPSVAATVPGFQSGTMNGLFGPAKTPETVIRRLNQEIVRFVHTAETKERLASGGIEPVGSTPQEFAAAIKTEMTMWGKVIKDASIRAD